MRRIGSDCTSGDECSRSVAIQIDTAELVSQTTTVRRPRTMLPATIAVYSISGAQTCGTRPSMTQALLACHPACCCHLLPPPATSVVAACFAKIRPEIARVWRPSWGEILSNQCLAGLVSLWSTKPPRFTRGINPLEWRPRVRRTSCCS